MTRKEILRQPRPASAGSFVDLAGYAACGGEIGTGGNET